MVVKQQRKKEKEVTKNKDVKIMEVWIYFQEVSEPKYYETVINLYTKGALLCVQHIDKDGDEMVHKYPLMNIFRIEHAY